MDNAANRPAGNRWFADDVLVGAVIVAFSVSIFVQAIGAPEDMMLFPVIVGAVAMLSGVALAATALLRPGGKRGGGFRGQLVCTALAVFMFAAMAAAPYLGFFVMLFVICFAVNQLIAFYCREGGVRSVVRSLVSAVVVSGATFVVFRVVLGIFTPEGMFV